MSPRRLSLFGLLAATMSWACDGSPFEGATDTIGAEITTQDTTMFLGTTANFVALAIYRLGPGIPQDVAWGVTDTTKLDLDVFSDLSASVTAVDTGASHLVVLVNAAAVDSVEITVVGAGFLRWRAPLSGAVGRHPAVGADSIIRVVHNAGAPRLVGLTPDGDQAFSSTSCYGTLAPGLDGSDAALATGAGCTARHLADGSQDWTVSVGEEDHGVALTADGGVVVLMGDVVIRYSSAGAEMWRETLGATTRGAPVIATNGDVYVPFSDGGGSDSLARLSGTGAVRWTVAVPGLSQQPDPALSATRIMLSRPGGVFALDTAGTLLWNRSFMDDNGAASATAAASAPVLDAAGGLYVQSTDAVYRYGGDGSLQWFADSLGYGASTTGVGAPVLRANGTLVVPCAPPGAGAGVREVCAVRTGDGSLVWRSTVGSGSVEGVAVGRAGFVYATRLLPGGSSEVVALWSQNLADQTGWPAAGGGMRRSRRRP